MLISTSIDETAGRLFGDPLRAEIVRRLAVEQLCTCHLVEMTGARQPTVSHHLKLLRDANLVDAIPDGRFTYYRLRPEPLAALRDAIADLAADATVAPRRRKPCE
jgi:ArsR family transcriptional regulator, arsenate/arsenite/antimonite-responsive transcriptional repressor